MLASRITVIKLSDFRLVCNTGYYPVQFFINFSWCCLDYKMSLVQNGEQSVAKSGFLSHTVCGVSPTSVSHI